MHPAWWRTLLGPAGLASRWFSCLIFGLSIAFSQTASTLHIASPASGTVVNPGQDVTVAVGVTAGTDIAAMALDAEDPIGFSEELTSPPYIFMLRIPLRIGAGAYEVTALALSPTGDLVRSNPIQVQVEPVANITEISVNPPRLTFRSPGEVMPLRVLAMKPFAMDITASTELTVVSENSNVAVVGPEGFVTASGAGHTILRVSFRDDYSVVVPVSVRNLERGDLNADGTVDRNDLSILLDFLNRAATPPSDARDLNGDGVIDALDARILVTLCTRPGCATE